MYVWCAFCRQDVDLGVSHEVVDEAETQVDSHLNGQVAESESASEEDRFLEPLCPVHSIILDLSSVNFMDSVGAKAIKAVSEPFSFGFKFSVAA